MSRPDPVDARAEGTRQWFVYRARAGTPWYCWQANEPSDPSLNRKGFPPGAGDDVIVAELREQGFEVIEVRSSQPAGGEALVDAISDLLAATEPYVEDAAPGETLFGPWAHRFDHLQRARHNAVKAVASAEVRDA
jgi:hypothetical protein